MKHATDIGEIEIEEGSTNVYADLGDGRRGRDATQVAARSRDCPLPSRPGD